jgi:hypothetical protein
MIDDCNDVIKIGNLTFYPSQVLKDCDPIAYKMTGDDIKDNELSNAIYELECDGQVEINSVRYILN